MTFASRILTGILVLSAAALGQSTTGTVSGTVVGDNGSPIPGARVFAATKPSSQAVKPPPTLVNKVSSTVLSDAKGAFTIPNLAPGLYVLCAQTATPGWLDPCHWSPSPPLAPLSAGVTLAGQKIVMTKGAVIQVQIADPSKLLPATSAVVTHDVEILALASNKGYYYASAVSANAVGRNYSLTLPFDLPHTLIVRSQQFTLQDSKGAAVAAVGYTGPVQVVSGTAAPQLAFTVTGKH